MIKTKYWLPLLAISVVLVAGTLAFSPIDIDGDGIPDSADACDNDPETVNGYQDTDGCPDTAPPASDPTTPVLNSAELILGVYNLAWTMPESTLGTPDGGYDIFIDADDTNEEHRTTSLQTQIDTLDTLVTHCFGVQARWTQTDNYLNSNMICVPPGGISRPPGTSTDVSTCKTLGIPDQTYVLTSDITKSGDCFEITADGITLDGNGHNITGDGSGIGLDIISSMDVTVQNLYVTNFRHGIFLHDSHVNTIKDSMVSQTSYGVNLDDGSTNNLITTSYFDNNVNGVHSWPSSSNYNTVTLNTFYQSGHEQVQWHGKNDFNLVYHNNFLEPVDIQVIDECMGCSNQWNTAAGGNYYDTYDESSEGCNDLNSDGFCDDPYIILDQHDHPNNQDALPFTKPNGWGSTGAPLTPEEALSSDLT